MSREKWEGKGGRGGTGGEQRAAETEGRARKGDFDRLGAAI